MNVDGKPFRTIWLAADGQAIEIIDQTKIPFEFNILRIENCGEAAIAEAGLGWAHPPA